LKLSAIIVAATLLLTVLLALTAGIGLSYLAAGGIVRLFAQRPQKQQAALTTAEAGSGGA
jgi:hypothetical protein